MQVQKRNGKKEEVSFDKVKRRLQKLCYDMSIDPIIIAQKVCSRIYDGVTTTELDELAAQICTSMITENLEFGVLGSRIIISNNHKNTSPSFSETMIVNITKMLLFKKIKLNGTLISTTFGSIIIQLIDNMLTRLKKHSSTEVIIELISMTSCLFWH